MPTAKQKHIFCDSIGIRADQIKVERVPHPTKRAHWVYRVSHPLFGEGVAQHEDDAWQRFFSGAEKKKPLPDRCQARTKKGKPCANAPQKGESYCGPHLDMMRRRSPSQGE